MDLLIVRHAPSSTPDRPSKNGDKAASLTRRGQRRMRCVAQGLKAISPGLDVIATSPVPTALESARILAAAYDIRKPKKLKALEPGGDRNAILEWLQERGENDTVAMVGHEPHLGLLASWLLAAPLNHFVELKKGGACLLTWPDAPSEGNAWLRWALTPGQITRLGRS